MGLKIHSRKSWGARSPRPRSRQSPSNVREVFLHWPAFTSTSAHISSAASERQELRNEQDFHMNVRGWSDIGYSFAVFQSGRIYRLRGVGIVPAAQEGHNTNTVAVTCILGPNDHPSEAMRLSLRRLKDHLDERTGRDLTVRAHGDVTATTCPGPHVRAIIPTLQRG